MARFDIHRVLHNRHNTELFSLRNARALFFTLINHSLPSSLIARSQKMAGYLLLVLVPSSQSPRRVMRRKPSLT